MTRTQQRLISVYTLFLIVLLALLLGCRQSREWYATNDAINTQMAATWTAEGPVGASFGQLIAQGQDLGVCPTAPVVLCVAVTATPPGIQPTASRTPTLTRTPSLTATATPDLLPAERIANGGFEGTWRPVIFPEVNVFVDWEPFYCDTPYTNFKCPAERRDTQIPPRPGYNSPDLLMGRPEFKPSDVGSRVRSGSTAQQWFCFFRACRAGVYQTIQTVPGEVCTISAWVQTWSAKAEYGTDGVEFHSLTATADDRVNSTWFIKVDLDGGTYAFKPFLLSQSYGYSAGHFDRYANINMSFTATGPTATIFFENLRLWPFAHNDSYLDDVSVKCARPSAPSPTPSPSATISPTPTATAIPASATPTPITPPAPTPGATVIGGEHWPRRWPAGAGLDYQVAISKLLIRSKPCSPSEAASGVCGWDQVGYVSGYWSYGRQLIILCLHEWSQDGDLWGSPEPCDFEVMRWSAIQLAGEDPYLELIPGIEG